MVDDAASSRSSRIGVGRDRVRLGGATDAPAAAVPAVGTARAATVSPCGPGTPGPSSELGVAPDAITVGVVADVSGVRALFRSNWEAMQAFAAYCNAQGGIAGRRLDVRLFDTNVFQHRRTITDACTSVFALVGSAAAFDGDGSSVETDCGIPDVPALVAEPAHERVPTVVAPLPNPQRLYLVGPLRYLARIASAAVRRGHDRVPRRRRHRSAGRPPGRGQPGRRLPVHRASTRSPP